MGKVRQKWNYFGWRNEWYNLLFSSQPKVLRNRKTARKATESFVKYKCWL